MPTDPPRDSALRAEVKPPVFIFGPCDKKSTENPGCGPLKLHTGTLHGNFRIFKVPLRLNIRSYKKLHFLKPCIVLTYILLVYFEYISPWVKDNRKLDVYVMVI